MVVQGRKCIAPAGFAGGCNAYLALVLSAFIELQGVQIYGYKGDTGEQDHHNGNPHPVLNSHRREHTIVAFIDTLGAGAQPLLQDNGEKRQGEYTAGDKHLSQPVVDDPAHQRQVILQVGCG